MNRHYDTIFVTFTEEVTVFQAQMIHFLTSESQPAIPAQCAVAYADYGLKTGELPKHVLAEAQRYEHNHRRDTFLVSRALVHALFKRLGNGSDYSDDFVVSRDDGGKPYGICNGRVYPVGISHTPRMVFAALGTGGSIGLDAEPLDRATGDALRRRILNEAEALDESISRISTIELWTIKESILKLEGTGLRTSMKSVFLRTDGDRLYTTDIKGRQIVCKTFVVEDHCVAISEYI
jgi:phosphopantetheinyl transferase